MVLYLAIALLSLLLGIASAQLWQLSIYALPWLMVFTATTASLYGLWWGLAAAASSSLLVLWLTELDALPLTLALLVLSAWLADQIGLSLRRAHRRAKLLAKSQQLIASALSSLPEAESRETLLAQLPRQLAALVEGGHVGVWLPAEGGFTLLVSTPALPFTQLPATGTVGRAWRQQQPVYLPEVARDPEYIPTPGVKIVSEVILPLFERGEVVALLNVDRDRRIGAEEAEGLINFAKAVSLQLERLADYRARSLMAELFAQLQHAASLSEAAGQALTLLIEALQVEAGVIWEVRGARMQALAIAGELEPPLREALSQGLPYGQGLAWQVYASGEPLITNRYPLEANTLPVLKAAGWRTLAIWPIPSSAGRSRRLLALGQRSERRWSRAELELIAAACRTVGAEFARLTAIAQHEAASRLFTALLEHPPSELYSTVLREAVAQVPGSEAGSLLVRSGERYHFQAAFGYELRALQAVSLSPEAMLQWYGQGAEAAARGEPRIMSVREQSIAAISYASAPPAIMDGAGRVNEIQANLCLPIPYRGEVLAYLNLDNLHDPDAFSDDSLQAAHFFAAQIAALLHESHTRQLLEQAALTDPLTGLPNRRAFSVRFAEELKRANRYRQPLSLAVLDLQGFKAINDHLGHAAGDEALIRVAQALVHEGRTSDQIFRWGGDEFAVLLVHTDRQGALAAANRYAQTIAEIRFELLSLKANIGLASCPEDGQTADALLTVADARMYQAKAQGLAVLAAD